VSILGEEWPLSAKEVFNRVCRALNKTVSYQAVHKVLKQLVFEGVLRVDSGKYRLDASWIDNLKKIVNELDSKYNSVDKTHIVGGKVINLTFNNYNQMGRFFVYKFLNGDFNPENRPSLCLMQHTWPTIGLSDEDYVAVRKGLKRTLHYCIVEGGTFLDKWFVTLLEKLGKKCVTGTKPPGNADLVVEGDYIAQVFFPYDFRKNFNAQYEKIKKADQLDIFNVFIEILGKDAKITVLITENQLLAEQLRRESISIFNRSGAKTQSQKLH